MTTKLKAALAAFLLGLVSLVALIEPAQASIPANGWGLPAGTSYSVSTGFLANECGHPEYGSYISGKYHTGNDLGNASGITEGTDVYAIGAGAVVAVSVSGWSWGTPGHTNDNVAVLIRHTASDGSEFVALYGHIVSNIAVNAIVAKGDKIGDVGYYGEGNAHLHFGIHPGSDVPGGSLGTGTCPETWPPSANGFVNPMPYLDSHPMEETSVADPGLGRFGIITPNNTVYAKDSLGVGGWLNQNASGINQLEIGDERLAVINGAGRVYAKDNLGVGGWLDQNAQAIQVAVGSTGRMVIITPNNTVYAKDSLGVGGWLNQGATAVDVAVGKNIMALVNSCGAVYAKDNLGVGGWIQQSSCDTATDVEVSSTGIIAIITTSGAVYAKDNVSGPGGWLNQNATAAELKLGGSRLMILTLSGQVYAKDNLGVGGWLSQGAMATSVAVTSSGRLILLNSSGRVYAKDNLGVGGWLDQNATASSIAG